MAEFPNIEELQAVACSLGTERWRHNSDTAQVVACYLQAHPKVLSVRYPGLKSDPLFSKAANTLRCGFGPYIAYTLLSGYSETIDCKDTNNAASLINELEKSIAAHCA